MSTKDYYKILGVEKSASDEEIKKAYRRLAHQHHPDHSGGDETKFKEINEAYQILSNKEKRRQYDQFGRVFEGGFSGFDPNNWEFGFDYSNLDDLGNVGDIFESFFEGLGMKKRKTYHRGADLEIGLEIELEDAFRGVKKNISFSALDACGQCGGVGHFPKEGFVSCSACDGRGEIKETRNSFFGNFAQIKRCGRCFGSGQIPNKICSDCSGTGRVKKQKNVEVSIAAGIRSGQIIKISGAGEAGERGAVAGDLYLKVTIKPHRQFEVRENDLLIKKELNLLDVLLGKKIKIATISGKEIEVEVPTGANLNEALKIGGEGMPQLNSRRRGDLYILLKLISPKKLSAKARKLIEDLRGEVE